MPTIITTDKAIEQGTFVITAAFTDEDGAAVVPDSITWTLTNDAGNPVNSREDVAVGTPAASINIVLSGNDLKLDDPDKPGRTVTIEAIYTSTYGSGLPLKDSAKFEIENLTAVDDD